MYKSDVIMNFKNVLKSNFINTVHPFQTAPSQSINLSYKSYFISYPGIHIVIHPLKKQIVRKNHIFCFLFSMWLAPVSLNSSLSNQSSCNKTALKEFQP